MFKLWLEGLINLIYPLSCLICKADITALSDKPLCQQCWNEIEYNRPPFCRVCGKHLPAETQEQALICIDCQRSPFFFRQARSVCVYDGIIKECIRLFKYKNKLSLAKPLSKLMIDFADDFLNMQKIDLILPVPLHRRKLRLRQFNQAQLLAQSLSQAFSKELQDKALVKIKATADQVNLKRRERLKNVQGTFKVKKPQVLKNRKILLIDDVLTTQATANECARILLDAGASRVDILTLARSN